MGALHLKSWGQTLKLVTIIKIPCVVCLVAQSCLTLCNPVDYSLPGPLSVGIFQARTLEWVAYPSSRRSSQPRDQTQVSYIAGRFFTSWATREAQRRLLCPQGFSRQEYWSGLPFPSSGDLSDAEIEPASPALAGRFFTTEPPRKSSPFYSFAFIRSLYKWNSTVYSFGGLTSFT